MRCEQSKSNGNKGRREIKLNRELRTDESKSGGRDMEEEETRIYWKGEIANKERGKEQ